MNKSKDTFVEHFKNNGIDVRSLFYPLSSMDIYKDFAYADNEVTKKLSSMGVSFPTHSDVDFNHVEEVINSLKI